MSNRRVNRRAVLASAAGAAAASIAAPAVAQSEPMVRWRLTSSFPKSLDTIYGAAEYLSRRVAAATDGRFQIQVFAAGEIVGGFQALDAVQNRTVEACHTTSYYYIGKDLTFAFDTCLPFGLNVRQQNAWMYHGGGLELVRAFYRDYNVISFPAGNTGAQMGGWFRKDINSVEDLKGLKFRCGGTTGLVLSRLGVIPQQIPAGDIYPALERGTIDAAEWIGPYDDEKLGFQRVAKNYYYPGWWEGTAQESLFVNLEAWNALPKTYQTILESACADAATWMVAKYDASNPAALRRLVASGAVLRAFPREVMQACYEAAFAFYEETAAQNASFKRIYDSWLAFRTEQLMWFTVAEMSFDLFNMQAAQQQRRRR